MRGAEGPLRRARRSTRGQEQRGPDPAAASPRRTPRIYYPWIRVLDPRTSDTRLVPPRRPRGWASTRAPTSSAACTRRRPTRSSAASSAATSRQPQAARVPRQQAAARHPQPARRQRHPRLPRRPPRHPRLGRAHDVDRPAVEVRQRAPAVHLPRGVDRRGHQWVVFEPNDEPTWDASGAAITNFLDERLAQRRADGHHAGGGLLRALRPHDDDPGRHRQRPADLPHRRRAGQAGRVRDLPHQPEDRRRET